MEVRRVVRMLIAVFLILTVLFYSLYRKESLNKSLLSEEFVSGAILNLQSSGVSVSADIIERKIPEKDIYVFDSSDIHNHNKLITEAIINTAFEVAVTTASFETPDGVSVGIYDKQNTAKEVGRVVFSNSDLSFNFSKSGVVIDNGNISNTNGQTEGVTDEKKSVIDKIINQMSPNAKYRISGSSYNEEYLVVSVIQIIDGYDIIDVFLNFVFEKAELCVVSGNWITETPKAQYHNTLVDGVNVLYKLKLDEISTVNNEKIVYSLRKNESGRFFLIPGWEITYTDKDGFVKRSYFDAL